MKIYRIAKDYLDIGHEPNENNPVYLWVMLDNGEIKKQKTIDPHDGHLMENSLLPTGLRGLIAQGRYAVKTKECSIYYLHPYATSISKSQWIKKLLREGFADFGGVQNFYEENKTFLQTSRNLKFKIYKISKRQIEKQKLGDFGGYNVFLVSEKEIRNIKLQDEEFTNFGIHQQFPSLIPENEIWIGKEVSDHERFFFIHNAIRFYNLIDNGENEDKAYEKALKYEKALREKIDGIKNRSENKDDKKRDDSLYIKKYETIDNIIVYIVDGELVRDLYKTDYVEGGHWYVYPWIPVGEIWIEEDLNKDEIPYIIHHEYEELKLMRDENMDYEKAHEIAAKKEFEMRKGNKRKNKKD